jgi:lysophospholipase L1-like esterase
MTRILAPRDTGAMTQWLSALANRNVARASVALIGDSIPEGQGATTMAQRMPNALATALRQRFLGTAVGGYGFIPPKLNTTTVAQPAVIAGAPAPAYSGGFGPGLCDYIISPGTGSITWTVTGTSVDVMYAQGGAAGVIGVSIDGGAVQQLNTQNAVFASGVTHRYALGAAGVHTVALTNATGVGNVFIAGIIVYNGDENAGIMVHDCSRFGEQVHQYVTLQSQANQQGWMNGLAPDLAIVDLGGDDYSAQLSVANTKADLTTLIQRIQGLAKVPSILLLVNYDPFNLAGIPWSAYMPMYYQLAVQFGCAILDMSKRIPAPNAPKTYGLFYADNTHLSPLGQQLYADHIVSAVSPV